MKWGVTAGLSETSHWTRSPDLRPRWHMGVKELRKLSRSRCGGGRPSCPLGLSRDPQLSQQTFTRPHTKHPPGRRGGVASFPFQTEGWNRGRTEGRKKKECNLIFLLLWCLRNAAFCPRLFPATLLCHFWSQAANLLIIAAKGWTCDLNSYFRSAVQREQRQSQQDGESSSLNCHTARHTAAVQAGQGQTARLFRYWEMTAAHTELQRFLSIWLIKQRQMDQIAQ